MRVVSLFDGMSCGQLALDKLGIKPTYFASEIDKYAMQVTKANYPNTHFIGDVTKVDAKLLPKIDLLLGGSPCQGFSFAGKQLNFDDPRSKLFFEYVRLLKQLKPKYFLLENVRMKKESQDIISEYLGVQPIAINSNLVSAQNRYRLYWTNIPNITQPEDKQINLKDIIEDGVTDRTKSHCIDANYFKGGNLKSYFEKHRRQLIFSDDSLKVEDMSWRKLTPLECERLQTVPDGYTKSVSNTQRYRMLGNGWTVDVISHILSNMEQSK